ncbi:hypothetical protein IC229_34420 [Spirosoma sp. BT702]|uniref:Uncharacterized protein n=1 Tax=Spirosoma profusum TaxID=2771354 RepID=A0A927AWL0_9BACT|nr:hypothetical protein [Spirosoma profusum]MBD2705752.1 hypothetical protein [Spirosoma profusum]
MRGTDFIELVVVAQGTFLRLAGWHTTRLSGWPGAVDGIAGRGLSVDGLALHD